MTEVRIITDVTAYIEPEWISRHRITVMPMRIRFGHEEYLIGPGDDPKRLFERMAESPAKPVQISSPPGEFQSAYQRLSQTTDEILVILSSGLLSDGVTTARTAARAFMGRCHITVMDSLSTSWGLGLIVRAASKAAKNELSIDEIVRLVRGMLPRIYVVFFVERLDYLEQGGRIGLAQALLGTMLRIKPLLLLEEGDIIPMEKVRTREMAVKKLSDFVAEFATIQDVVILRSPLENDFDELVAELSEQLAEILPGRQFPIVEYDPVLACHIGPQALGICVSEGL
jgi:DegV family protein with EDD domain